MLTVLFIVLLCCFVLNFPICFALGIASMASILAANEKLMQLPQLMVYGVNSFPLLAIPFFMLAGAIMDSGGVSRRNVAMADAMVGHIRGGIAAVSIVGCTFFAAISGSTPATAAAIGSLTIPEMVKRGYDKSYASAVVASAGCLGVIIPPSITMVLFGVTANVSVGKLLIGGMLPGLFLAGLLMLVNYIRSRQLNYPTGEKKPLSEVWASFKDAFWALLMPVIILGGIMVGIFTPTESACVAVIYGLLIGFFVYKELKVKDLVSIFYRSSLNSAMIVLLIAMANPFGRIMTTQQVPNAVTTSLLALSSDPLILFCLIILLYLFLGTFMETGAIILIVVPIMAPVMQTLGMDMVHFGVVSVIALAIGMATPPVGISLFATCSVSKVTMKQISEQILPFLGIMIFGLFVLACVPQITLCLPDLLMSSPE